jgi:hypothetical protein
MKHGFGSIIYPDGSLYEGNFEDDVVKGYGIMIYKNKSYYYLEIYMRESGSEEHEKVMANIPLNWAESTRENGMLVKCMGKVSWPILMGILMKALGNKEFAVAKENIFMRMEIIMMVNGKVCFLIRWYEIRSRHLVELRRDLYRWMVFGYHARKGIIYIY